MAEQGRQREQIRMAPDAYAEPMNICSVTIATAGSNAVFANDALASACVEALLRRSVSGGVTLYAYCLMPDHLHLLLSPSRTCSIIHFVHDVKGETTNLSWRFGHDGQLWQRSFYDHFLRQDEDVERVMQYILANPVRAGLVVGAEEYPYSGCRIEAQRAGGHEALPYGARWHSLIRRSVLRWALGAARMRYPSRYKRRNRQGVTAKCAGRGANDDNDG